jgi:predicted PurR-regulated permease PerM
MTEPGGAPPGRLGRIRRALAERVKARPDTHARPPEPRPPLVRPPTVTGVGEPVAMPRWLPRALVMAAAVVAAFLLGFWLLGRVRDLLVLLVLAQFLAFALEPAVNWLADRGWRRGVATGVVMLVVTVAIGGLMFAIGSLVVSQLATLVEKAPAYIEGVVSWSNDTFGTDFSSEELQRRLTGPGGPLSHFGGELAANAVGLGTSALSALFSFLTVALFAFYLCADGPRVRHTVCSMLPPARQREVLRAWEIAIDKTGGYLYSRLLLAVASGILHYVVLRGLGVPYALALAVWVGLISQLVPTVGTYLAAALPLVVALVTEPRDALWLLVFIVVYQQFENYLLQPKVTARTMNLHPAVAFGAVIAGAAILGGVGALLAIPFVAIVQSFLGSYIRRYEVTEHPLTELDAEDAAVVAAAETVQRGPAD